MSQVLGAPGECILGHRMGACHQGSTLRQSMSTRGLWAMVLLAAVSRSSPEDVP